MLRGWSTGYATKESQSFTQLVHHRDWRYGPQQGKQSSLFVFRLIWA